MSLRELWLLGRPDDSVDVAKHHESALAVRFARRQKGFNSVQKTFWIGAGYVCIEDRKIAIVLLTIMILHIISLYKIEREIIVHVL